MKTPSRSFDMLPAWVRIRRFLCGISICGISLLAQVKPVAFVDVNVVPMDTERIVRRQTVVVENGSITAIGPARSVHIPKSAQRIDGRSKFLMPGLADMHVHFRSLSYSELNTFFVANGVTTVRSMAGRPEVLELRHAIEQGRALGPQIYTTGPITDGRIPGRKYSTGPGAHVIVDDAAQASAAVMNDRRAGYDAMKVHGRLSPEAYQAIVSRAHSVGMPVYGHVPVSVGVEGVLAAHQDSIEHVDGYLNALDRDASPGAVERLVAATVKAGTWNCLTLVFFQGAVPPEQGLQLLAKPSMRFVSPELRASWRNDPQLASLTPYQFSRVRLYDEKRKEFVRALHRGGAKILLGTDTPLQYIVPGFAVHEELRNLVDVGLTPYEAIRAATSDAAEFLKSADKWGAVAVGMRADLILTTANPLQDVRNVSQRAGVMVHGRWLPEKELQEALNRLATAYERGASPH
jgi:imidazolonepropionase-like amidohydrolase